MTFLQKICAQHIPFILQILQLFFNLSKLGLTTREFGVPVEWYDEWNVVGLLSLVSVAQPIDHLPGYCRMMHTAYSCTV